MTASILQQFYLTALLPFDKSLCELFIGAFFFVMRSCEYVKVQGPRKTKLLTVGNIRFYKGKRLLAHSDQKLHKADCVLIVFEFQKKDTRNDIISHYRSTDTLLCPVKTWAKIIRCIASYPTTNSATTVNYYQFEDSSPHYFTGKDLLSRIRLVADTLGPDELGFSANQLGLHSARSGAAMAMCLADVPVFTIMILGRWSSDAFLHYIRKQVQEFSKGISQKMISNERFFTLSSLPSLPLPSGNQSSNFHIGSFKDTILPLANAFM
jgi:hypothetical protein